MKKLILLALFVPVLSFGQKFEVSEMVGGGFPNNKLIAYGLSNEVSLRYYVIKQLSFSAIYETEPWMKNTFGATADYHLKWFYAGVEVKSLNINTVSYRSDSWAGSGIIQYDNPFFGTGVHVGIKQHLANLEKADSVSNKQSKSSINKKFCINMQVGFTGTKLTGTNTESKEASSTIITIYRIPVKETFNYFYVRIGLSYQF